MSKPVYFKSLLIPMMYNNFTSEEGHFRLMFNNIDCVQKTRLSERSLLLDYSSRFIVDLKVILITDNNH